MNDPRQKLRLAKEALEAAVCALEQGSLAEAPLLRATPITPRERAMDWLAARRRRALLIDPALNEGSWAILMDLFVNKDVRPVSISSACIASGHPATTALRWVRRMIELELIAREDDGTDGRRAHLVLTARGEAAVLAHLGR